MEFEKVYESFPRPDFQTREIYAIYLWVLDFFLIKDVCGEEGSSYFLIKRHGISPVVAIMLEELGKFTKKHKIVEQIV
ncbi:hypothetical protein ACFL2O_01195 [Thermodesulfobacteriota bacterium]